MIDEKLNSSLKELESNLLDMKTLIDTNKELSRGVLGYVDSLNKLTKSISDVTSLLESEYRTTTDSFSKKCDEIVKASEDAVVQMNNSATTIEKTVLEFTDNYNTKLSSLKKASYAIIALSSLSSIAAIIATVLLLMQ